MLSERIKCLREETGLSQSDFGERVGVGRQAVYYWESGTRTPSDQMLSVIANKFNVSFIWLKDGDGEMYSNISEQLLDDLAFRYGMDEIDKDIIRSYLKLDADERAVFKKFLQSFAKKETD